MTRYELPHTWRMIIHLEKTELTPTNLRFLPPEPVCVDGRPEYEIERIIQKEVR